MQHQKLPLQLRRDSERVKVAGLLQSSQQQNKGEHEGMTSNHRLEWRIESELASGERYESLAAACEVRRIFCTLSLAPDGELCYAVKSNDIGGKFAGLPIRYRDYGGLWPPGVELLGFMDEKPAWFNQYGRYVNRSIIKQIVTRQFGKKREDTEPISVCVTQTFAHKGTEERV